MQLTYQLPQAHEQIDVSQTTHETILYALMVQLRRRREQRISIAAWMRSGDDQAVMLYRANEQTIAETIAAIHALAGESAAYWINKAAPTPGGAS